MSNSHKTVTAANAHAPAAHAASHQSGGSDQIDVTGLTGAGGASLANGRVLDTASSIFSTASATFVDVTGMSVTLTTGAHRVLVVVQCTVDGTSTTAQIELDIAIDGTRQGGSDGLVAVYATTANVPHNGSFAYLSAPLTAASHTIKLQARAAAGTVRVYLGGTGVYASIGVMEQGA